MNGQTNWPGFFLVLDGIDGCGKSTQAKLLTQYFESRNIPVHLTSEPSKGEIGKLIRQSLKNASTPAAVDALLFAADRVEHCLKEILPQLEQKKVVISDRFIDSSFIYQSIQGVDQNITLDWVKQINKFAFEPDTTIIIDIDPNITFERKTKMGQNNPNDLEKFETLEFLQKVREGFVNRVKKDKPNNYQLINGNQSIEQVTQTILKIIEPKLQAKKIF